MTDWPKCERCGHKAKYVVKTAFEQFVSCETDAQTYDSKFKFPVSNSNLEQLSKVDS